MMRREKIRNQARLRICRPAELDTRQWSQSDRAGEAVVMGIAARKIIRYLRFMRVNVVYDNEGNVLAATVVGENADEFVLNEGESADEFDVPGELEDGGLSQLLKDLRVDIREKSLRAR
jgi:hypothetical protein